MSELGTSATPQPGVLLQDIDGYGYSPPPSTGWVVHELIRNHETDSRVWAWCKVEIVGPGYTEMVFTRPDGKTPADPGNGPINLGPVLFQLWC